MRLEITFKEKLARLRSKGNKIHDAKRNFSVKNLFNKCEWIRSFSLNMFTFAKKFLTVKFIFCALICTINRQETAVKKKFTDFLENYVASLFTTSLQFANFYSSVFRLIRSNFAFVTFQKKFFSPLKKCLYVTFLFTPRCLLEQYI